MGRLAKTCILIYIYTAVVSASYYSYPVPLCACLNFRANILAGGRKREPESRSRARHTPACFLVWCCSVLWGWLSSSSSWKEAPCLKLEQHSGKGSRKLSFALINLIRWCARVKKRHLFRVFPCSPLTYSRAGKADSWMMPGKEGGELPRHTSTSSSAAAALTHRLAAGCWLPQQVTYVHRPFAKGEWAHQ